MTDPQPIDSLRASRDSIRHFLARVGPTFIPDDAVFDDHGLPVPDREPEDPDDE